jgi:hypothetical protein
MDMDVNVYMDIDMGMGMDTDTYFCVENYKMCPQRAKFVFSRGYKKNPEFFVDLRMEGNFRKSAPGRKVKRIKPFFLVSWIF